MKKYTVAIAGNPNSGKTTLFNILTGSRQHVGNWPGVTVEKKVGYFTYKEKIFEVVDLPGTYSLSYNSLEEKIAADYIIENKPDIVINIIDGTSLERSLYLTTQLIDSHIRMILVINMYDEVEKKGVKIDIEKLEKLLKFGVVPIIARKEMGIDELLEKLEAELLKDPSERIHINYDRNIEKAISEIECILKCFPQTSDNLFSRWISVQLLSGDTEFLKRLEKNEVYEKLLKTIEKLRNELQLIFKEEISEIIYEKRMGFIMGLIKECVKIEKKEAKINITEALDNIFLSKYIGFLLFALIMWFTFQITFNAGGYLSDLIEMFLSNLTGLVSTHLPEGILKDLLIDGVISGVGGVLVFLPQIMILFLIIAFLEDSGYMARIAFIMDRFMHFLGLHGRSFISMFMGIGCNVPGIMATRTLETEEDRKITALINPFMSCSARLPVYTLITGMFFPKTGGMVIFFLYITGIIVAVATAKLLKTFVFRGESIPFVMELPPYRLPTLRSLFVHMWERGSQFLKKMGGVILVGSVIIWALSYFPKPQKYPIYVEELSIKLMNEQNEQKKEELKQKLAIAKRSFELEYSYIGKIGRILSPVFKPLGFSWKEGVALLTGIVGKEVVVSTISVLYNVEESGKELLKERMERNGVTPPVALGFLVFVLLYVPCVATMVAIMKETNSAIWTVFSLGYGILVAYILSFVTKVVTEIFLKLFAG